MRNNRIIKFRAFCEIDGIKATENKMVYFKKMECDNGLWFNAPDSVYHINEYLSEPMQYTGLKDKNGKEIYEGDIVIFLATTNPKLYTAYANSHPGFEEGQKLVVKSLLSGFTLSVPEIIKSEIPNQFGHIDNYSFWNNQRALEVIGNIHENPELIKD